MKIGGILLVAGLPLSALADLSWDYVDARKAQAAEATQQREAIEQIHRQEAARQPSAEETAAYRKLGEALASHPGMAEANRAESAARAAHEEALESGINMEILLASSELAEAKAERFRTAAAIPELKALIEAWQRAAVGLPTEAPSAEEERALDGVASQLERLRRALAE